MDGREFYDDWGVFENFEKQTTEASKDAYLQWLKNQTHESNPFMDGFFAGALWGRADLIAVLKRHKPESELGN